jgi:zinc transport system substrate-binding protein
MRKQASRLLFILGALCVALALAGCSAGDNSGKTSVVASFYPLAWAARGVGGSRVDVEDLTPPGVEAHDTMLTAGQRADLETADVVLTLGHFGFQPDIEKAATDAQGTVVDVTTGLSMLPSNEDNLAYDPHVWLDPVLMKQIVGEVRDGFVAADPQGRAQYDAGANRTEEQLTQIDNGYRAALTNCRFSTFVTTHEAFGYLAQQYGLHQLGIEGLTPESEPSAASIQAAVDAIKAGTAAPAVFYEATDEGRRVGESVAADAGVEALPLGTLESAPTTGDYVSIMNQNLASLEKGLQCAPAPTPAR